MITATSVCLLVLGKLFTVLFTFSLRKFGLETDPSDRTSRYEPALA